MTPEPTRRDRRMPLSVVIATTQPWPGVRACLDSLLDQARDVDAEVIVAAGSRGAVPEDFVAAHPHLRCVQDLGASVFALRALGIAQTWGDIVAITEDHCRVAPDWCRHILRSHREHPDAAAIGGAVENGTTSRLIEWATFFLVLGRSCPPSPLASRTPSACRPTAPTRSGASSRT